MSSCSPPCCNNHRRKPPLTAAADSRHRRLSHRSRCWHGLCAILDYASTRLANCTQIMQAGERVRAVSSCSSSTSSLPPLLPLPLLLSLRLRRLCSSSAAVVAAAQRESHILSPRAPRFRRPRLAAAAHARTRQEQNLQARQGSAFSSSLLSPRVPPKAAVCLRVTRRALAEASWLGWC